MASAYAVPGVYYEPRPRVEPRPLARTDVAGFVGFEPRVRDGSEPCRLLDGSPKGHRFQVDVLGFQLAAGVLGSGRTAVAAVQNLPLSASATAVPMPPGGAIRYAVVAVLNSGGGVELAVAAGAATAGGYAPQVADAAIAALAAARPWVRIADVVVRYAATGERVFPCVEPALPPARCDDWNDFVLQLGGIPELDDGTLLAPAVRLYFANGGARCHVATIRRPLFDDVPGLRQAAADLVGVAGASELEATGLERLLRIFEVAVVDVPDLYARRVDAGPAMVRLPPRDASACFRPCAAAAATPAGLSATGTGVAGAPVFGEADVLDAQKKLLLRCAPERWRVLLLLAAPVAWDAAAGAYGPPDTVAALAWRAQLDGGLDSGAASVGAFYHPWALAQEKLGAPVVAMPPTALAAGIIARRDLARGPHVAAANERLVGVVGLSPPLDEAQNAAIYAPPRNINPLRAFPGQGVQIWGARTLSSDPWLRYLSVRRCLSAIQRRALVALRPLVFEPNTPTLWFQVTQAMLGILLPVFNAGALRGDTPEQAFYVRCDESNNPADTVAVAQVLCEVGVAIAAPAEFIVFRVGRREAVVEILE